MKNFILLILTLLTFCKIYPQGTPEIKLQIGNTGIIPAVALSPDGRFGLSGCQTTLILWDIQTGKELRRFVGHDFMSIVAVAFTNDSRYAISGSCDETVRIWDIATGKSLRIINTGRSVTSLAVSPDGKSILVGTSQKTGNLQDNGELNIYDINTGNVLQRFYGNSGTVSSVAFSPDGRYAVSGEYQTVKVWDIASGSKLRTFPGYKSLVQNVAVSGDGKYVLAGSYKDLMLWDISSSSIVRQYAGYNSFLNTLAFLPGNGKAISTDAMGGVLPSLGVLNVFDVNTGKIIKSLPHICTFALAKDGKTLLAGMKDGLTLFDLESGNPIKHFSGSTQGIEKAIYYQDKQLILSKTKDKKLKVWDVSLAKQNSQFFPGSSKLFPDGKTILALKGDSADHKELMICDLVSGNILRKLTGHTKNINSFDISPDGKLIVSGAEFTEEKGGGELILWDAQTGREMRRFNIYNKIKIQKSGEIKSLQFSPDGQYIVSNSEGFLQYHHSIWDVATGKELEKFDFDYRPHPKPFGFSPDGCYIYSEYNDIKDKGKIVVWDIKKARERFNIEHSKEINAVAVSTDSKLMVLSEDYKNSIVLYDFTSGQKIKEFKIPTRGVFVESYSLAFSPDGKFFLSGNQDGNIRVWDIEHGNEFRKLTGHLREINSVQYSKDGKFAVSGSEDGTTRLWDISTGYWVSFLSGSGKNAGKWLVWTSDGYWDASPNGGDLVAMVAGTECWNIDQFATKNNRPDIILTRLGSTDSELIKHYNAQYLKRLKKLGLSEKSLSDNYFIPTSKIIETKQNGNSLELKILFKDDFYKLKQYNVFINDVPLFGAYGKSIEGNSIEKSETILLGSGSNKVEVSCMNEKGAESYRTLTFIENNTKANNDLYFLAFGVSKYKDPALNLQFADKDANDLNNAFKKLENKGFTHVYSKVLTNEEVTPESIKASKDFVANAKPDDYFVLYIAGHGVYEKGAEASFYYLTNNADLNNLPATCASFESIEDLLQGIAPRNKLFLMDACESGELDEDEQASVMAIAQGSGMTSRGFKKNESNASDNSQGRTYLYQKDRYIYNDLARRSGAIVFSSSKGGELSYERSDLENGLFTEFIIKAITSAEADIDTNGTISIEELRDYVSSKVAGLSGERQHPTIDRDNIFQKLSFKIK